MASKQTQKGARFEYKIVDMLKKRTGVEWNRTPMSGAGVIKGDIFAPKNNYFYCFECKSFENTVIQENLLSAKSNNLYGWWEQTTREAAEMNRQPGLIFKKDRGKPLIAVAEYIEELNSLSISSGLGESWMDINIYLFEEWLEYKDIEDLVSV